MKNYTNYCTLEQTKKAYELGAPIEHVVIPTSIATDPLHKTTIEWEYEGYILHIQFNEDATGLYKCPTTQQMRGWLMSKGLYIEIALNGECYAKLSAYISTEEDGELDIDIDASDSYKDIESSAIDAALDYLEKGETK